MSSLKINCPNLVLLLFDRIAETLLARLLTLKAMSVGVCYE